MRFPTITLARPLLLAFMAAAMCLPRLATPGALAAPAKVTKAARVSKPAPAPERLVYAKIESTSLANNAAGESATRTLQIYLPPSYFTQPERRFPVIYFLHGYDDRASLSGNPKALDELVETAGANEFIIVQPSCANAFYVNSPATGNWEDFIVKELVAWTDAKFRTLAKPAARGIGGFSMGGFGAINLGLRHPDVFQAVYAVAPGLVDNCALKTMYDSWDGSFIAEDYSNAFSPDPANPGKPLIPHFDGTPADAAILEKWADGFGNLDQKVAAYKALGKPLAGIGFQVGKADYDWLVQGTVLLDQILVREGIDHRFELTEDPHMLRDNFITTRIMPFFSRALQAAE